MLGNIRFFMEFDFYRGVKLTFILPLILVAIGYLRRFPLMGQTIASPEDLKVFVKDFLNIPIKMGTILILAVLALAGVIFVGRSGHTAGVPVPGVEVAMRRFLENVLYARPREKEFLIGHPAFYLMVAALYRKWPQLLHFFLVIAAAIGVGSMVETFAWQISRAGVPVVLHEMRPMVETFAHIRTPFLMSFIRGINGWVTGMVIGIGLIIAIAIVSYVTTWLGKQVAHRD